jgi:hypothetical protein
MSVLSVSHLSKKFARQALRYGVSDVLGELMPRRRSTGLRTGEFWALDRCLVHPRPGPSAGLL